jgi:hypothetical protein
MAVVRRRVGRAKDVFTRGKVGDFAHSAIDLQADSVPLRAHGSAHPAFGHLLPHGEKGFSRSRAEQKRDNVYGRLEAHSYRAVCGYRRGASIDFMGQVLVAAVAKHFRLDDPIRLGQGGFFLFRVASLKPADNIHTFDNASEDRVFAIQVEQGPIGDEELGSARIGRVGSLSHTQHAAEVPAEA